MKVYSVKKTTLSKSSSKEEILLNTVFSSEDAAKGAMNADIELEQTPLSEVIVFNDREMQLKTGDVVKSYCIEEHEYADGKLG